VIREDNFPLTGIPASSLLRGLEERKTDLDGTVLLDGLQSYITALHSSNPWEKLQFTQAYSPSTRLHFGRHSKTFKVIFEVLKTYGWYIELSFIRNKEIKEHVLWLQTLLYYAQISYLPATLDVGTCFKRALLWGPSNFPYWYVNCDREFIIGLVPTGLPMLHEGLVHPYLKAFKDDKIPSYPPLPVPPPYAQPFAEEFFATSLQKEGRKRFIAGLTRDKTVETVHSLYEKMLKERPPMLDPRIKEEVRPIPIPKKEPERSRWFPHPGGTRVQTSHNPADDEYAAWREKYHYRFQGTANDNRIPQGVIQVGMRKYAIRNVQRALNQSAEFRVSKPQWFAVPNFLQLIAANAEEYLWDGGVDPPQFNGATEANNWLSSQGVYEVLPRPGGIYRAGQG
jgi:hypothetical protein